MRRPKSTVIFYCSRPQNIYCLQQNTEMVSWFTVTKILKIWPKFNSSLLTQDLDITFAMSLAIGTFDSYVKALTKSMLWTVFCTRTSLLLKQKNWDPEKDLCWVVLRKVHVYMFVYHIMNSGPFLFCWADRLTKQTIDPLWRRLLHRLCLRTVCPTTQRVPVARLWLLAEREIWLLQVANKFQLQASPMWLRLVIRIFLWASKSLQLGSFF